MYSEEKARELVIEAGLKLLENGLIARTWGNISARISDDEFVITPSGRSYEDLKAKDLVKVKASDLSYEGDIKPSSEKGVHAIAYILRPEVDFIIHTHQFYATAIGIEEKDTKLAAVAGYGLSGTKKLKDNIMKSIAANPSKNSFLMTRHGALCLGKTSVDAFLESENLERECKEIFESVIAEKDFVNQARKSIKNLKAYVDDFAQILGASVDLTRPLSLICSGDDKEAQLMILEKNCAAALYAKAKRIKPLPVADASLQRIVYLTKYSKLKDKK